MSPLLVLLTVQGSSPAEPGFDFDLKTGTVITLPNLTVALRGNPASPEVFIAPELRNEAIYLRGKFESSARLRALVARATSAEWVRNGSGLVLERSPALRKRLREEERVTLAEDIRAALRKEPPPGPMSAEEFARLKTVEAQWDKGESEAEKERNNARVKEALFATNIEFRFGRQFLAALDPVATSVALLDESEGGPVRFLGAGGGGFAPLPVDGPALLARYRADRTVMLTPKAHPSAGESALAGRWAKPLAQGELGVLATQGSFTGIRFGFAAVLPDGTAAPLGTAELGLSLPRLDEPLWPGERPDRDRKTKAAGNFPPEAVAKMFAVKGFEPLYPLALPFLEAFCTGEKRPIVLDLSDETSNLGDYKTESFRENSEGLRAHVAIELYEGAIVGRPRLPLKASANRFPRAEIPRWFVVATDPNATLEAAAEIDARIGTRPEGSWIEMFMLRAAGTSPLFYHPLPFDAMDRAGLRLWAALPEPARAALDRGETVGSGGLRPEGHWAIWRWLLTNERRGGTGIGFLDRRGALPPLELSWRTETMPLAIAVDGMNAGAVNDGASLGSLLAAQRRGEDLEPWRGYPDVRSARFRPGERVRRTFSVAYSPKPIPPIRGTLSGAHFERGPGVKWDELPPAILDPLRAALGSGGSETGTEASQQPRR